jgi:hypothetical protein
VAVQCNRPTPSASAEFRGIGSSCRPNASIDGGTPDTISDKYLQLLNILFRGDGPAIANADVSP